MNESRKLLPAALFAAVALAALPAAGCNGQGERTGPRAGSGGLFGPSPRELAEMAFDPKDADNRREGIDAMSKTSWGRQDKYLKGYALVLSQDGDASVRAAAVRALGRSGSANYLPNVVAALSDGSPAVRLEAAVVLNKMTADAAARPLCERAILDDSADVRMWCAKALRNYRQAQVLSALVRCLDDPSFSVVYHARRSLAALTGKDMGNDPVAWAPVLAAGLPPERADKPWWDWSGAASRRPVHQPAASQPATQPAAGGP
jgi:hypothetical protein